MDDSRQDAQIGSLTRGLEPSRETMAQWLDAFGQFALDHAVETVSAPAMGRVDTEAHREAADHAPSVPEMPLEGGLDRILELMRQGVELSLNTTGPGYLAYIPGGGLFPAALADLVSNVMNRFTGIAGAAPLFVKLEADVLRWLSEEFGLGPRAHGLFTTGGSSANLTAFITARHVYFGDTGDFRDAVAYTSAQAHHSVAKGLRLAGIPPQQLRAIPTDEALRMDAALLEEAIEADKAAGRRPFLIVSAAGTTNTGAVDPLHQVSAIAKRQNVWHHVDGAYGGAFALCAEGKRRLGGIERADSITFDPHKGMFLPYGTGCLLVADRDTLARAHHSDAEYLEAFGQADELIPPSPTDLGPDLSRDYRGLRVWLSLMLFGANAFREALNEKLELGALFYDELRSRALPIDIISAPDLSVVAFRLARKPGESLGSLNTRNQAWLKAINSRKRVHLSGTTLSVEAERLFTLRMCVLSYRTHRAEIEACLEDLTETLPD